MEINEALQRLVKDSFVPINSSQSLVRQVAKRAAKLDRERRGKNQVVPDRKPNLVPVDPREHENGMHVTPWELLHTLGRATALSGQGSSRALSQHWSCLKYITTLQDDINGRMELSPDGRDPRYHRKSVQAEDLGIAFALAAALRIARKRHPHYRFEVADADVALEGGWALRGAEVKSRENVRLRPDYFLVGFRSGEPVLLITVECKGSHGRIAAQHEQLAKASAQVNSVAIGGGPAAPVSPPSLMMATALAAKGGIEMHILDPEGGGVLVVPGRRAPILNGPVEQLNEIALIPVESPDGSPGSRAGFHIPPGLAEWFSRILARTSAAALLAFIGDRATAHGLLSERQGERVGTAYSNPGSDVPHDVSITLGGIPLVGTDHVFRFGSQRMEVFSGMPQKLHAMLARRGDIQGYHEAVPHLVKRWNEMERNAPAGRKGVVTEEWGGVINMDDSGAVLGLRLLGKGKELSWGADR